MKQRILVVADDAALRASLARWLMSAGYAVELAQGARRAREVADRIALAIVALDRLGEAGPELARDLARSVGALMIVADRAQLATWGPLATAGCLAPPLDEDELLTWVRAALPAPASAEAPDVGEVLRFDGITLDLAARTCVGPGGVIALTRAEFSLLAALARRPGRVLSRSELQRAVAGRDAERDDRSVDVLMSRLRRKIETDPKEPRLIVTVLGEGYRLSAPEPAIDAAPAAPAPAAPATARTIMAPPRSRAIAWSGAALALVAGVAILSAILFWYPGYARRGAYVPAAASQKFDAAVVPLVEDGVRATLAAYPSHPDAKALAISGDGWGLASGAPDSESAKREALERCGARARNMKTCRIYAIGMDVVFHMASLPLPLPADIHDTPLDAALVAAEVPTLSNDSRVRLAALLRLRRDHKALAIAKGTWWLDYGRTTRAETARLAVERCSDLYQVPCLLVSIDGFLTLRIPKSRRVVDLFMLTSEAAMSDADKARIGETYRQPGWRALARGRASWHAAANAASEAAAVDAALAACARADTGCRLYAIENFRVAEEN